MTRTTATKKSPKSIGFNMANVLSITVTSKRKVITSLKDLPFFESELTDQDDKLKNLFFYINPLVADTDEINIISVIESNINLFMDELCEKFSLKFLPEPTEENKEPRFSSNPWPVGMPNNNFNMQQPHSRPSASSGSYVTLEGFKNNIKRDLFNALDLLKTKSRPTPSNLYSSKKISLHSHSGQFYVQCNADRLALKLELKDTKDACYPDPYSVHGNLAKFENINSVFPNKKFSIILFGPDFEEFEPLDSKEVNCLVADMLAEIIVYLENSLFVSKDFIKEISKVGLTFLPKGKKIQ
jgi:hypothetical protein